MTKIHPESPLQAGRVETCGAWVKNPIVNGSIDGSRGRFSWGRLGPKAVSLIIAANDTIDASGGSQQFYQSMIHPTGFIEAARCAAKLCGFEPEIAIAMSQGIDPEHIENLDELRTHIKSTENRD